MKTYTEERMNQLFSNRNYPDLMDSMNQVLAQAREHEMSAHEWLKTPTGREFATSFAVHFGLPLAKYIEAVDVLGQLVAFSKSAWKPFQLN